jgi:hypothetical protein
MRGVGSRSLMPIPKMTDRGLVKDGSLFCDPFGILLRAATGPASPPRVPFNPSGNPCARNDRWLFYKTLRPGRPFPDAQAGLRPLFGTL